MVGIERMGVYVPRYVLSMEALAQGLAVDPGKCLKGIGQERMAVPPPDEDVVTMGAAASERCLRGVDRDTIAAVVFSTESGVDHSKAASVYVHELLGLPKACLCWEVKQACSGSTMAFINALDFVARRPEKKVLVIASDIAVYEAGSPGELTQGAGAVAVLVSSTPVLVEMLPELGCHTRDVMDFWRPNYSRTACVDGHLSIKTYLQAVEACWQEYRTNGGIGIGAFERVCFHQPFARMADKALGALAKAGGRSFDGSAIEASQRYNRQIGNTYSASLLIGLCSLLESDAEDLGGATVGFFGYGSGAVAAFYAGRILPGYAAHTKATDHGEMLRHRECLDFRTYREWHAHRLPTDGSTVELPRLSGNAYRFAGLTDHKRRYEAV